MRSFGNDAPTASFWATMLSQRHHHYHACQPLPRPLEGSAPADIDLGTLTYFHHFHTITSLTPPDIQDPPSAKHHWQMHDVSRTLRRRWLMCHLLAICAHHFAALADDTLTKRIHCEQGVQFSSGFSAGLGQTTGYDLRLEAAEIEEEAKKTVPGHGIEMGIIVLLIHWQSYLYMRLEWNSTTSASPPPPCPV